MNLPRKAPTIALKLTKPYIANSSGQRLWDVDETTISAMANIGNKLTVARPRKKGCPRPKHPTRNPAQNRKRIVKKDMPSTAVRNRGTMERNNVGDEVSGPVR